MDNTQQEDDKRFHHYHGNNIMLSEDNTVAHRTADFGNSQIYSSKPLFPGELFLVEIIENQRRGWCGHLDIGLSHKNPNVLASNPEVQEIGESYLPFPRVEWTIGISKREIQVARKNILYRNSIHIPKNVSYDSKNIRTCRGVIPRYCLKSSRAQDGKIDASDVGSRIGVMFIPTSETIADMHVIINGIDEGPLYTDIPYRDAPIYATINLRGSTKKIKIIQLSYVPSLKAACRNSIIQSMPESIIHRLQLPKELKKFLLL
ncbi:neuralized-like protein 2 [Coccinella septempunctata]|uniref:neuralized-like protein 2 n=1 Tax=Coccinella septempunctata TaxID=41139 RepID=UPI001D07627B|nr:neuralized-like protein 2 [Coccinella septempunctata]